MSSTRRTEMPAKYISTRDSSTDSPAGVRSMIAVSKGWRQLRDLQFDFAGAGLQRPIVTASPGVLPSRLRS